MREKKPCIVATFYTTAEAMATERLCREKQLTGKLFSLPRSLSADCGIAWQSPIALREELQDALRRAEIETEGFYELSL